MANLSSLEKFLLGRKLDIKKKVRITTKDSEGNDKDLIFEIKSMSRSQVSEYNKQAIKVHKDGSAEVDDLMLSNLIIKNHCLQPDFNNAEFLKALGKGVPIRAVDAINMCLTPGEATALAGAITQISGLDNTSFEILEDSAKKSLPQMNE